MTPGRAVAAVVVGFVLFAIAAVGVQTQLPEQEHLDTTRNYGYVCSSVKSSSVAFSTASDAQGSLLLFGSSELATSRSTVPQVPAAVFGTHTYGIDLNYVGEDGTQSLWHAIAAGAYAGHLDTNKCAIIVSPEWFADGGLDETLFGMRFSYGLYRAFCENTWISDASKAYAAKRLVQQGVAASTVDAGMDTMPQDRINDTLLSYLDDLKLRGGLQAVRARGIDQRNRAADAPAFDDLREQAYADAQEKSTNNDLGYDNAFYSSTLAGKWERLWNIRDDETLTDTHEYDDLNFFLKVCREVELEPLVIIAPLSGDFYDYEGVTEDVRNDCYTHIRHICEKQEVPCVDLTTHEYDKYYLHDTTHFGGPGWVDVEEAIYNHANG